MGELSFLTIIISLAVCSLLVYAVFQYMKVRFTILEQSHKEQALILQQFIEESSTDIHRLYQMNSQNGGGYPGSIILEYANENANREYEEKPIAYNEPHMIHLDTAIFQNKRNSNLIEISSDSEDTTDSETSETSDASEASASEASASEASESEASEASESEASDDESEAASEATDHIESNVSELVEELVVETVNSVPSPETKMITVDLGTIPSSEDQPLDVMEMLNKKEISEEAPATAAEAPATAIAAASFTGMSVTELRYLLKEKNKHRPEKHAEIQKMKKAELIQALQ